MFRMIKGNVERLVETEFQKNRLLALGYSVVNTGVPEDTREDVNTGVPEDNGENVTLDNMTVEQLRIIAKENNISGYSNMNKAALLENIKLLGGE